MTAPTCDQMRATLVTYLAARDNIAMGRQSVAVRNGDKSVQYGPANLARLDSLVAELRGRIARCCDGCARGMIHITPSDGRDWWW